MKGIHCRMTSLIRTGFDSDQKLQALLGLIVKGSSTIKSDRKRFETKMVDYPALEAF